MTMSLAIKLTAEQERRLTAIAERLSVSPAVLAEAAVRELVAQPDAESERIFKRILEKNRELYERLR
jgi:predicted transcriptional regulator